jgi:hypothetical protein
MEMIGERLYDVKHLASQPQPGEKSGCFSSWDRALRTPEKTGKYENWHANGDGNGFMDDDGTRRPGRYLADLVGDAEKGIGFTIHTEKEKDADDLLRYPCKWHRDDFGGFDKAQLETERWPD